VVQEPAERPLAELVVRPGEGDELVPRLVDDVRRHAGPQVGVRCRGEEELTQAGLEDRRPRGLGASREGPVDHARREGVVGDELRVGGRTVPASDDGADCL
jgi:hypothetical protein